MSVPRFLRASGLGLSILVFVLGLLLTAANAHAATVSAAVPDDANHSPGTPSSLALLATGLAFLLIIRTRYRLR